MAKKTDKKTSAPKRDDGDDVKKMTVARMAVLYSAQVDQPAPGDWLLADVSDAAHPSVYVMATGWEGVDSVWAIIHPYMQNPAIPANAADLPGAGFTLLNTDASKIDWDGLVWIPAGFVGAQERLMGNNLAVTIVYVEIGGAPVKFKKVGFKLIDTTYREFVPGWACPWFAYRGDDVGPEGEDIPAHRPTRVRFPSNAATVSMAATGWWRHQPIDAVGDRGGSGPDGRGNPFALINKLYQTESDNVSPRPAILEPAAGIEVNSLVGLLEWANMGTASQVFKVGAGPHALTAAEISDSNAIHLGLWDGTQWTRAADEFSVSNSGQVRVTFTWTT